MVEKIQIRCLSDIQFDGLRSSWINCKGILVKNIIDKLVMKIDYPTNSAKEKEAARDARQDKVVIARDLGTCRDSLPAVLGPLKPALVRTPDQQGQGFNCQESWVMTLIGVV
ncbi:hypothetical protein MAR_037101 [Mya arenaria]|uniref:Uncharacterized protein n=1 Tax=Mya arenaria TaxID=6604 RepID=A0ABY7FPA0_MYAAR|nr:hypothetical protein MAR_037101 [Mya arenaria]